MSSQSVCSQANAHALPVLDYFRIKQVEGISLPRQIYAAPSTFPTTLTSPSTNIFLNLKINAKIKFSF